MRSSILIAGAGSIGSRHLRNLLALGHHDILFYRRSNRPVAELPAAPVYADIEEALAQTPFAAVVAVPTSMHVAVATAAANAGCHLLVEKPLSDSWAGVEPLLDIVRRRRLVALAGFDMRFDPGLRKVRQLLQEKTIGDVCLAQIQVGQHLADWHPWEDYRSSVSARRSTGGGVLLDLIHELDYATWLLGPVERIDCICGHVSDLEIETEDVAAILMRASRGAVVTLSMDYLQRPATRTARFIGTCGTIEWDYMRRNVRWWPAGEPAWQEYDFSGFDRNDRFLAEMKHWLACLRGDETPAVDLEEAGRVLRLALLAKQASAGGASVVVKNNG